MLGFVGPSFFKSLKAFQVISRDWNRSFENTEKIFREKKKQLGWSRALAQEKYELQRAKYSLVYIA